MPTWYYARKAQLEARARRLHLHGDRFRRYVFGTLEHHFGWRRGMERMRPRGARRGRGRRSRVSRRG